MRREISLKNDNPRFQNERESTFPLFRKNVGAETEPSLEAQFAPKAKFVLMTNMKINVFATVLKSVYDE